MEIAGVETGQRGADVKQRLWEQFSTIDSLRARIAAARSQISLLRKAVGYKEEEEAAAPSAKRPKHGEHTAKELAQQQPGAYCGVMVVTSPTRTPPPSQAAPASPTQSPRLAPDLPPSHAIAEDALMRSPAVAALQAPLITRAMPISGIFDSPMHGCLPPPGLALPASHQQHQLQQPPPQPRYQQDTQAPFALPPQQQFMPPPPGVDDVSMAAILGSPGYSQFAPPASQAALAAAAQFTSPAHAAAAAAAAACAGEVNCAAAASAAWLAGGANCEYPGDPRIAAIDTSSTPGGGGMNCCCGGKAKGACVSCWYLGCGGGCCSWCC